MSGKRGNNTSTSIKNFNLIPLDEFNLDTKLQFTVGGYGKVIKATHKSKNVVMKTIWGKIPDWEMKKLDTKIGTLKHPNLLEILGLVHSASVISPSIIVLPFMKNGSLLSLIAKSDLNKQEISKICQGIVGGMIYLHSREITHRVLCAENVLLDEDFKPKISDYGIAEAVNPNTNLMNKKKYCGLNGSIPFPAVRVRWVPGECIPTHRSDVPQFSAASDVWSFGVLLCEMWGRGKIPYGEERQDEEVIRIIKGRSNPLFIKPLPMPNEVREMAYLIFNPVAEKRPTFIQILSWFADSALFLSNVKNGTIKKGNSGPKPKPSTTKTPNKKEEIIKEEKKVGKNQFTVTGPLPTTPPFPIKPVKSETTLLLEGLKNAPENSSSFSDFLFRDSPEEEPEKGENPINSNGFNSVYSTEPDTGSSTPAEFLPYNDIHHDSKFHNSQNENCLNSDSQNENCPNSDSQNENCPNSDSQNENCPNSDSQNGNSSGLSGNLELQNEVMQLCLNQLKIMEKIRAEDSSVYLHPFFNNPYCFNPFVLLNQMTPAKKTRKEEELEEKIKVLENRISSLELEMNII